jgi:hypothetical protein
MSHIFVKGDVPTQRVSPFYLIYAHKKEILQVILHRAHPGLHAHYTCSVQFSRGRVEHKLFSIFGAL